MEILVIEHDISKHVRVRNVEACQASSSGVALRVRASCAAASSHNNSRDEADWNLLTNMALDLS